MSPKLLNEASLSNGGAALRLILSANAKDGDTKRKTRGEIRFLKF